ncbi:hypothetical protein LHA26_01005 [Sphingomonas morindae]|uniref:Uncharacterized protein n=2 Tax=Sphingomonas morindae TaxID=1541170 RepID=A0ABY4X861_9SPHN|nr:hypothetical protein [Sphingomonas morindae]USI73090.1 hypothetical protein LHA26_01005 [Sphingomonas morindae]
MSLAGTIAVCIPVLAIGGGIVGNMFQSWMRLKRRQLELMSETAAEKAAQYAAKTERLEQRVAVLERILTDRSTSLADEIDRLRDSPLN